MLTTLARGARADLGPVETAALAGEGLHAASGAGSAATLAAAVGALVESDSAARAMVVPGDRADAS
jgi:hypothetical protein